MTKNTVLVLGLLVFFGISLTFASDKVELQPGIKAPLFTAKTHDGKDFALQSREGKWTVLYFYPKAGTPGCTKQACAFRDNIEAIHKLGAEVYGVSSDSVEDQAKFHTEHKLNFTLLADPDDKVIQLYGSKMPVLKMSKRWTFIISPALTIVSVDRDVDPVLDAKKVAEKISKLQLVAPVSESDSIQKKMERASSVKPSSTSPQVYCIDKQGVRHPQGQFSAADCAALGFETKK